MSPKSQSIPVHAKADGISDHIFVSRASFNGTHGVKEVAQSHRDDWHLFLLQEKGTTTIEIDFKKYVIKPSSVVYIHPTQVHRLITFNRATISNCAITNENLKREYLDLLEAITPVKVLSLKTAPFSIICEAVSFCLKIDEQKQEKLYKSILKDSCNTLIGLIVSQYIAQSKSAGKSSRFEHITKAFRSALEHDFIAVKSPMEYAKRLTVSTPYLNECVKNATGHSVSYHIQQRIVLEAKRLLYHSNRSVKEIATELGYDDHSYFIRLFAKVAGMTPMAFRNKNLV